MPERGYPRPLDPLYGELALPAEIIELQHRPIVQRLRHIRLSNIDSLDLPGIASVTRYEHALGACHLAGRMPLIRRLSRDQALIVQAAALLHDWAITPFAHLVEEAAEFVGQDLSHEAKLAREADLTQMDLGGADVQLLHGIESGLSKWLQATFEGKWVAARTQLTNLIEGDGAFGQCIAGTVDLDNLDNVTRIAFHMGLELQKTLGAEIASSMVDTTPDGSVVFERRAIGKLKDWAALRKVVYTRLMFSALDFVGKVMLTAAAQMAFARGGLHPMLDWKRTDADFISALVGTDIPEVQQAVRRWIAGDVWESSELYWIEGPAPSFVEVRRLSEDLSAALDRPLHGYRIRDKRNRLHHIHTDDGAIELIGSEPRHWLLGFASPTRKRLSAEENRTIGRIALDRFGGTLTSLPNELNSTLDLFS